MTNSGKHTKEIFELFSQWYNPVLNSEQTNSNAFVLSSADRSGKVSSRVVLLKDYDDNGFVFYTNYLSRKGQQLSENPMASMLFYWPERQRQIKIEGRIQKVTAEESMIKADEQLSKGRAFTENGVKQEYNLLSDKAEMRRF